MSSGPVCRIWTLNKCSWINEWMQSDFTCSLMVSDLHNNITWDRPLTYRLCWLYSPHGYSPLKSITHRSQCLRPFSSNSWDRESFHWPVSPFFQGQVMISPSVCYHYRGWSGQNLISSTCLVSWEGEFLKEKDFEVIKSPWRLSAIISELSFKGGISILKMDKGNDL